MRILPALLSVLLPAFAAGQQLNPADSYQTVVTEHFRIHYTPQLNPLVATAAQHAENAYLLLRRELAKAPPGPIDLVLSDNTDLTNGFAMPFPSNRVVIFVQPPVDMIDLQYFRDWLELVITHELAHIFHLDTSGRLGRGLRAAFGRVPFGWPVFSSVTTPRWLKEGLAVEFESRATGSGRIHGSYNEMLLRTAVLEDAFEPIDRFNSETVIWPGGQRAYAFGSLFNDYLARTYGPEAQSEIVSRTAGSWLPPELGLNRIAKRATGSTFTESYRAWGDALKTEYEALRDSLSTAGTLTETEQITATGRWAQFPRISPDGRYLAFAEEDGYNTSRIRIMDTGTRETVRTIRRNGLSSASWLADGSLITSQYEFAGPYNIYSDLYRIGRDGNTVRLSTSARLQSPDINRAGTRIVAVRNGESSSRLVILDQEGNTLRAITPTEPGVNWIAPRFSPEGDRIVASRWKAGDYDVVVLDTAGQVLLEGPVDPAVDGWPAWSPDGRYVLFHSDRTGIANLYALDTQSPAAPLQITNVLTGAFQPEVSPDGRWIYFAAYHADGFHIERIAYDPSTWRPQLITRVASSARPREDSLSSMKAQLLLSEPHEYSAWSTLRPYYWLPYFFTESGVGDFVGGMTSGTDVIGRHSYTLDLGLDLKNGRMVGGVGYTYARLGNPLLNLYLARTWDGFPVFPQAGVVLPAAEREDRLEASTSFVRRRWRSSASLTVGGEVVHRKREVLEGEATFTDPEDQLFGPVLRAGFANYRYPRFAISPEDGVVAQGSARWRFDPNAGAIDRSYRELSTWTAAYKSLGRIGFAHHVLAARFSALYRDGDAVSFAEVGGVAGGGVGFGTFGADPGGFLPVRGFESGDRAGSRAWTASAEWRVPIKLVGRGKGLWPVFLDGVSGAVFADAGNASCSTAEELRSMFCATQSTTVLSSTGAELGLDVALGFLPPIRTRIGYAVPLSGPRNKPGFYLTFGQAF